MSKQYTIFSLASQGGAKVIPSRSSILGHLIGLSLHFLGAFVEKTMRGVLLARLRKINKVRPAAPHATVSLDSCVWLGALPIQSGPTAGGLRQTSAFPRPRAAPHCQVWHNSLLARGCSSFVHPIIRAQLCAPMRPEAESSNSYFVLWRRRRKFRCRPLCPIPSRHRLGPSGLGASQGRAAALPVLF